MHELHLGATAAEVVANLEREFAAELAGWLAPLPVAFYLALLFGPCDRVAEAWRAGRREPGLAEAQQVLTGRRHAGRAPCRRAAPQARWVVPRTAHRPQVMSPGQRNPRPAQR